MMKFVIVFACALAVVCGEIHLDAEEQQQLKNNPNCKIPCSSGEVKNISHPYDCSKYSECKNGVVTFKNCSRGHKFSTDSRTCVNSVGSAGQGCLACFYRRPSDY